MMGSCGGRDGAMALPGKLWASDEASGARFVDNGLVFMWYYGFSTELTGGEGSHATAR